jgi:hypothetical protein
MGLNPRPYLLVLLLLQSCASAPTDVRYVAEPEQGDWYNPPYDGPFRDDGTCYRTLPSDRQSSVDCNAWGPLYGTEPNGAEDGEDGEDGGDGEINRY